MNSARYSNSLISSHARTACLWLAMLTLLAAWVSPLAAQTVADPANAVVAGRFEDDLKTLTAGPHRLSGTKEGQAAAAHIEKRLREMGIGQVMSLDIPVSQTVVNRCDIEVGGRKIDLLPLRPNLIITPSTPEQGLTGPLMYVNRGTLEDYAGRDPHNAIVVMEYDSGEAWQQAFALGAKAVIFLGSDATPVVPKHAAVPMNLVRLYASPEAQKAFDFRKPGEVQATVNSAVAWKQAPGRNVLAFLPGTAPAFPGVGVNGEVPEVVVLAANYDTFGNVPHATAGARGAANVAALLQTAEYLQQNRPRRDVLIAFVDNQARYHQGARYLYDVLYAKELTLQERQLAHKEELKFVSEMLELLKRLPPMPEDVPLATRTKLLDLLERQAEFIRSDINQAAVEARLTARDLAEGSAERKRLVDLKAELVVKIKAWDNARRALHNRKVADVAPEVFAELATATAARMESRLDELHALLRIDEQSLALKKLMGKDVPVLHMSFDLSDRGNGWGVIAGEWTERSYGDRNTKGDSPGYYTRVLTAFRAAATKAGELPDLVPDMLADPQLASRYVPGMFVSSGTVAGAYKIHNVTLVTAFDGRPRDGHPADTLANLKWRQVLRQSLEARKLAAQIASVPELSLSPSFQNLADTKMPGWSGERATGDYIGLQITGSLSEDRPASGAILAIAPKGVGVKTQDWRFLRKPATMPFFDPLIIEEVDGNGRFPLIGVRKDVFSSTMLLGAIMDQERGQVSAISSGATIGAGFSGTLRTNLFPARGHSLVTSLVNEPTPATLKVLSAASDAAYPAARSLYGQQDDFTFFYTSTLVPPERIKVFQDKGPVLLNIQDARRDPYGRGILDTLVRFPPLLDGYTATDLWQLNEARLKALRTRGVTSTDLEVLHSRAKQRLEEATRLDEDLANSQGPGKSVAGTTATGNTVTPAATVIEADWLAQRQAAFKQSEALSRAVYNPLRQSMDDLVYAIVVLLLLAIPFAFAMERLLVAATTIYQRLAGFSIAFLITFALLFFMHPGFAIASTPIIIFLAFTILLLSSLVIYIIVRKFKVELAAMQGQGTAVHQAEVSRMGTLLAAVAMGMSTMRRRPTRTFLTAVTVVMLTFTILCFASVSNRVGVRSLYEGPVSQEVAGAVMVRHLNYKALSPHMLTLLGETAGPGGVLAPQYWLIRGGASEDPFAIARADVPQGQWVDGVLGLSSEELRLWPQLAATLGGTDVEAKIKALENRGVFLPAIIRDKLQLQPGDAILFNGKQAVFAGVIEANNLQRLKQLDGRAVAPVNPLEAASDLAETNIEADSAAVDEIERDFVYLSPDLLAVASDELVRDQGGKLYAINIYPRQGDPMAVGQSIAQLVNVPVWARGPQGVQRMIFTKLTDFSGGTALVVPVVLGGLIIFGTLLGSISDRQKEIYTFSALGLAPAHVGFLFFAEAAVYAVVGGMGGQLLAQTVALGAAQLARWNLIQAPDINYSSTNSLFAIGLVMATVLISAIYPALRASKSANPGLARTWRLPKPEGDRLAMTFPFTVSAYDITGVMSFLAEHFRSHNDAGLGHFATQNVSIQREDDTGHLRLNAHMALAPFDLGVTQNFALTARPSEIKGVDEVFIETNRDSGANGDWYRANRVFVSDLRKQFLLWRTLSAEVIEEYRLRTLQELGGEVSVQAGGSDGK